MRKPIGSEVKWAEFLLIIGTGCWVHIFAGSSIAQSVCEWVFSLLTIWGAHTSCIQQWKTTCLLSIRKSLACARASNLTATDMYECMYVCKINNRHLCMYSYINCHKIGQPVNCDTISIPTTPIWDNVCISNVSNCDIIYIISCNTFAAATCSKRELICDVITEFSFLPEVFLCLL